MAKDILLGIKVIAGFFRIISFFAIAYVFFIAACFGALMPVLLFGIIAGAFYLIGIDLLRLRKKALYSSIGIAVVGNIIVTYQFFTSAIGVREKAIFFGFFVTFFTVTIFYLTRPAVKAQFK